MATKSFIQKRHQLDKINKLLKEVNEDAINALVEVMTTTEDEKVKKECAKELLYLGLEVTKIIEADKLQRAVLDVKLLNDTGANANLNWVGQQQKTSINFTDIIPS